MSSGQGTLALLQQKISDGFQQQRSALVESEDKIKRSEQTIAIDQRDVSALRQAVQRREREIELAVARLAELRDAATHVSSRNTRLSEQEHEEAKQRDRIREEYVAALRESAARSFERHMQLRDEAPWSVAPSGRQVVEELQQLVGELDAAFFELASAPTADALLSVGFGQHVFECVIRADAELRERLPDVPVLEADAAGSPGPAEGPTSEPAFPLVRLVMKSHGGGEFPRTIEEVSD